MPVIDDYTLTVKMHGVGGYTGGLLPLHGPTVVWGAGIDDGTSAPLAIGFSFDAFGTVYTDVMANTNGWMLFGSTSTLGGGYDNAQPYRGANGSANPHTMCIGWWDDLKTAMAGGYGRYETQGIAPNRAFIFEWSCQAWYVQTATNYDRLTWQVVLRETSNDIEYRYAPIVTAGSPIRANYSASCGARVSTIGGVPSNVRDFLGTGYAKGGDNTIIGWTALTNNPPTIQWPGDPGNTDQGGAYDFHFAASSPPPPPPPSSGGPRSHCSLGLTTRLP